MVAKVAQPKAPYAGNKPPKGKPVGNGNGLLGLAANRPPRTNMSMKKMGRGR